MGLFSILPESLGWIETWCIRVFLLMAFLAAGPWLLLLSYDVLLYIFRSMAHEMPYFGGRAQGKRAPRAPTLKERPSGRKRSFTLPGLPGGEGEYEDGAPSKPRLTGPVPRTAFALVDEAP